VLSTYSVFNFPKCLSKLLKIVNVEIKIYVSSFVVCVLIISSGRKHGTEEPEVGTW
jgi:hypothetical protein